MLTKGNKPEERIVAIVTNVFRIPLEDIIRQVRTKEIAEARQVVAYCLRLMTSMSFPEIGKLLGGRDHTTAMHSCSKIAKKIESDGKFRVQVESILDLIRNQEDQEFFTKSEQSDDSCATQEECSEMEIGKHRRYDVPSERLELNKREEEVLGHYRHGKTLREIAETTGVTRERVRQIAFRAILKEIGAKMKAGFEINVDECIRGEKATHDLARRTIHDDDRQECLEEYLLKAASYSSIQDFSHDLGISVAKLTRGFPEVVGVIENNLKEKTGKRWSKYYIKCRLCGTTTMPHARRGYCQKCFGLRPGVPKALLTEASVCAVCSIDRGSAIRKYERDLYAMKDGRVLCRGCFLQFTGSRLAKSRWERN